MLMILLGLLIGIASGYVQFLLLYNFITTVTGGKSSSKTVIFAITQFLFPFAILVLCGFFLRDVLMWVGIGMGSSLIISAGIKFYIVSKSNKNAKSAKSSKTKKSGKSNKSDSNDKTAKKTKSTKSKKSGKTKKK